MSILDFAIIAVPFTIVLLVLLSRAGRRSQYETAQIKEAKKTLLAAHISVMRARASHAARTASWHHRTTMGSNDPQVAPKTGFTRTRQFQQRKHAK